MKPDSRRVYVFIVLGLIAAVVVGVGVWRMSTPSARYSNAANESPTSSVAPKNTSAEESTTSSTHKKPSPENSTSAESNSGAGESDHQRPQSTDPYLAPNAVTHPHAATRPTKVYRPGNVYSPDASANNAPSAQGGQAPQNGNGVGTMQAAPDNPSKPDNLAPSSPAPSSPAPSSAPSEGKPGQSDQGGESGKPVEPAGSDNPEPPSTQAPQKSYTNGSAQRTPSARNATTEGHGAGTGAPSSAPQAKNKSHAEPEATGKPATTQQTGNQEPTDLPATGSSAAGSSAAR
ncbi:hypothetical protein [Corynebacterium sp. MSK072]|uniref:hypothetical protein n=1 Tax=Corynebacterium rhinophilum TaxID=3050197 RepID=UPI00254A3BEB|nr:hypothetical protein [Corynebacterium sp. MSK072]MDK8829848.1 hypothetical protein [Corynebacterium sp. MSK072]